MARVLTALTLVATLLTRSSSALAEPPRVVLVRPALASALAGETLTRAQAELRTAGFAIVVVDARGGESARETSHRADPTAVAVIAIVGSDAAPTAEVWVEGRLTGTLTIPETAGTPRVQGAAGDLAIQAVELLRASLVEIEAKPRPAAPKPLPPAAKAPAREAADVGPDVGGLALAGGGAFFVGMDPGTFLVAPTVSAALVADVGLGARLRWAGPGAGPSLEVPEGSVTWTPWLLTAGGLYEAILADVILLRASGDVGLIHVAARGELEAPAESREGSALDAAFLGGGAAGVFLAPSLALTLGAEVLLTAPPPVVRVGGREVATVGRPWLFFPVTLEIRP